MNKNRPVMVRLKDAELARTHKPEGRQVPLQTTFGNSLRTRRGVAVSTTGLAVVKQDTPAVVTLTMVVYARDGSRIEQA